MLLRFLCLENVKNQIFCISNCLDFAFCILHFDFKIKRLYKYGIGTKNTQLNTAISKN